MSEPNDDYIEDQVDQMAHEMREYLIPVGFAFNQAREARLAVIRELREWVKQHDVVVVAELVIPYGDLLAKLDEMEKRLDETEKEIHAEEET